MKYFIAITIVKWFKQLGFAGRLRFKMLYWAYRITGWHIRHREWDFVLDYLPTLSKGQNVSVLDVGCSRSLFCHEVVARGYKLTGIDLEQPYFKYPGIFWIKDIRTPPMPAYCALFDFITCISVFEHIGDNGKGKWVDQETSLTNMIIPLKIGGRLLLTIPTYEFAQGHIWHGFNHMDIKAMLPDNARIIEYTERMGQICMCIARIA